MTLFTDLVRKCDHTKMTKKKGTIKEVSIGPYTSASLKEGKNLIQWCHFGPHSIVIANQVQTGVSGY